MAQRAVTRDGISQRPTWLPAAAVLLAAGWGSNQFTPMLLVYRHTLDLGTTTLEAMFGLYALGLIPGLLVAGALSDARGRRPVAIASVVLSLTASVALVVAGHDVWLLFAGRALAGVSSGAAFSAGTAWLRELSRPASDQAAARGAVAMTAGFALGPLVSGLLAQWAPAPTTLPYLPHLVLTVVVLAALRGVPETVLDPAAGAVRRSLDGLRNRRFRTVVAPMAPWVFAAPAIAFALLPSVVGAEDASGGIALTAVVTAVTAFAGVAVQPVARRLDRHRQGNRAAGLGLLVLVAGLLLAALTAWQRDNWLLLPSAIVLGTAYGLCLVAGLIEVQRLADQRSLAGLTAIYYTLTYLGFAAPYLLAIAARLAGYPELLVLTAALALATATRVTSAGHNMSR